MDMQYIKKSRQGAKKILETSKLLTNIIEQLEDVHRELKTRSREGKTIVEPMMCFEEVIDFIKNETRFFGYDIYRGEKGMSHRIRDYILKSVVDWKESPNVKKVTFDQLKKSRYMDCCKRLAAADINYNTEKDDIFLVQVCDSSLTSLPQEILYIVGIEKEMIRSKDLDDMEFKFAFRYEMGNFQWE